MCFTRYDGEIMPKEKIMYNELSDYQESQQRYNKMLDDGPLMERIGSFEPPRRKGYEKISREMKMQDSLAKNLYLKREKIARSLVESRNEEIQIALNKALVSNNLSPNSYKYWDNYMNLLIRREGGWDIFIKNLENELHAVQKSRQKYSISLIFFIIGMFSSIIIFSRLYGQWWGILLAVLAVAFSCAIFAFYHLPRSIEYKEAKEKYLGNYKKNPEDFYPYTQVIH